MKRILNAQSGSMFWNYIKVNDVLIVQNVNPSLDYRLYHRASIFSKIIYLPPVEEFTSGELGSNQTINHNTSTPLLLQLKTGLDWGNGDYEIYNTGTFKISGQLTLSSDSDIIYKAELSIKKGNTVLITGSINAGHSSADDDMAKVTVNVVTLVELQKGDLITAHGFQMTSNSGSVIAETGKTEIIIERIGGFLS